MQFHKKTIKLGVLTMGTGGGRPYGTVKVLRSAPPRLLPELPAPAGLQGGQGLGIPAAAASLVSVCLRWLAAAGPEPPAKTNIQNLEIQKIKQSIIQKVNKSKVQKHEISKIRNI